MHEGAYSQEVSVFDFTQGRVGYLLHTLPADE